MKNKELTPLLLLLALLLSLSACENVVDIKLDTGPTQLAVDGWLTNETGAQTITLTRTTGYFDAAQPPAATGATVEVIDESGKTYKFLDTKSNGRYTWTPAKGENFGTVGLRYGLKIQYEGQQYYALSQMNPVPPIDSLVFRNEKINPVSSDRGYRAEFYANDLSGQANYYWIRAYKNGKRLDRTTNILVAYDAAFNGSSNTDGLMFILPIRQSINPDTLYRLNDQVRVELLSITPDAFYFLQQLSTQINNSGLFANPPANVPTNVINQDANGPKAVGFFGVSAVQSKTLRIEAANIRASDD